MAENSITILGDLEIGLVIANWISETLTDNSVKIYFASPKPQDNFHFSSINPKIINLGHLGSLESQEFLEKNSDDKNFLITCYWPWILPEVAFSKFKGRTLNFHPAFLPFDKGWYPHVHQIRENTIAGVTLHQLSADPDSGAIWVQEKIFLPFPLTAGEARLLLIEEIVALFKAHWWKIYNAELTPAPQIGIGNYWKKSDVEPLNTLSATKQMSVEELIRAISCRNIGKRSFFKIQGSEGVKFVHIEFSDTGLRE